MDFEVEKVGKSKIHELHTESTDQNQQNILKTNKSQKKIGVIFWWGFSDLGRKQQNQARNHGVGAPKT